MYFYQCFENRGSGIDYKNCTEMSRCVLAYRVQIILSQQEHTKTLFFGICSSLVASCYVKE